MLAAGLFLAWIGWLAFLAATTTHPVVLSRPQLMVSTLDVIAQVDADDSRPAKTVTVKDVHWPPARNEELANKPLVVTNLAQAEGWDGPGEYILPLIREGKNYEVAAIPSSPGYSLHQVRIYRRTAETLRQLQSIYKPEGT
jgi:hypothetical protein